MAYNPLPVQPWEAELQFEEVAHRYTFRGIELGSVTTVLKDGGASSFDPTRWKASLIRKGMTDAEAEVEMERARNDGASRGSLVHLGIENRIVGTDGCDASVEQWMRHWERFADNEQLGEVLLCERRLVNPVGYFCGSVDCVAEVNGKLCAVDWKTVGAIGKAKSQAWQGAQLAAYAATVNRLWGLEITDAVNVHVGPDGYKLTTWNRADLLIAWKSFLECLQIHWGQKEGPDAEAAMASIRAEWLSEAA